MLVGSLVNAGVGFIADWIAGSSDEEEKAARQRALQEYASLSPPDVQDFIAREVSGSATSRARVNEGQRAVQDEVQGRLMERGRAGGMDLQSRARAEQARMEAGQHEQEMREGALANLRSRGMLGSGEELLARLQSGQSAANRERMAGVQSLADADEAAMQALIAGGGMAGQREQREWGQQMDVANAEDDIARFNAGEYNRFQLARAADVRARFDQQFALADRKSGIHQGDAAIARRDAQQTRQQVGGLGQAAGFGIASYGQYQANQQPANKVSYSPNQPATVGTAAALQPALQQQGMPQPAMKRKAR